MRRWVRPALWLLLAAAVLLHVVDLMEQLAEDDDIQWLPHVGSRHRPPVALFIVAASGTSLLLIASLAVLLTRRRPARSRHFRFERHATDNRHLVAFVIYFLSQGVVHFLSWRAPTLLPGPVELMLLYAAAPAALIWMASQGSFRAVLRREWGVHTGRGWLVEVGWGLIAYLAFWCAWKAVALWELAPGLGPAPGAASRPSPWWVPLPYLFGALVYAPVVEEAFFRGALYREVRRSLGWFGAGLAVAVLFALSHSGNSAYDSLDYLWAFFIGLALCFLREWRDSLVAPMTMHLAINGVPHLLAKLGLPYWLV